MYDTLFYTGDSRLSGILWAIESFADKALLRPGVNAKFRILIYSDTIYLPWQLLHAVQEDETTPDPMQSWGNKYVIGVIPIDQGRDACGRLPGDLNLTDEQSVVYVRYWEQPTNSDASASGIDIVSDLAERFGSVVKKTLNRGIIDVHDKDAFTDELKKGRNKISVLLSFTHGHSGSAELDMSGKTFFVSEVAGQRLDFSSRQSVSAREISTATVASKPPYFSARPFVFLNGCETGTEGSRGTTDMSLPGVFLKRGARAVISTESPIWDFFGYDFGELYLEKLIEGSDAGEAMLNARVEFLKASNNPLGLLYSYYGNPAVRLVRSKSQ
jgi:hypothetical protein